MTVLSADLPWWDIPWQDWLGVGGTVLGGVGIWLTWLQARAAKESANKAETAAQAATAAVERTQTQLRANLQLVLLPGLQRAGQELDHAIERESHAEARACLDRWRFQAGHIRGLLQHETPEPRTVLRTLQASMTQAQIAAGQLLAASDKPVLQSCTKARASISDACDEVTQLVGKNITQVTPPPGTESQQ